MARETFRKGVDSASNTVDASATIPDVVPHHMAVAAVKDTLNTLVNADAGDIERDVNKLKPVPLDAAARLARLETERQAELKRQQGLAFAETTRAYNELILNNKRLRENEFLVIQTAIRAYNVEQEKRASEPWYKKLARKLSRKDDLKSIFSELRTLSSHYTNEEIMAILNNQEMFEKHEDLVDAFVIGGGTVENEAGEKAVLYTLSHLAAGALGSVKDAYVLKDGKFHPAVVKAPLEQITAERQQAFNQVQRLEAYNAKAIMAQPIAHVMRPLFVSRSDHNGLVTLVYEKVGAEKSSRPKSLEEAALDPQMSLSKKIRALSYALDGADALRKAGFAHLDIKPSNIVLDDKDQGTLIDLGSVVRLNDDIRIFTQPSSADMPYGQIRRNLDIGEGVQEYGLSYSPFFTDLDELAHAAKYLLRDVSVADRRALGASIFQMLELSHVVVLADHPKNVKESWKYPGLKAFPQNRDYIASSPMKSYFKGGQAPASLARLLGIANELLDITNPKLIQRPLGQIAQEVRQCAQEFEQDLDAVCKSYKKP